MTLCLTFVHELSYIIYCHPQTTFHTPNTDCKHQMKNIPTSQHFSIHSDAITAYTLVIVQLFEYFITICPYLFIKRSGKHINEHSDTCDKHHTSHNLISLSCAKDHKSLPSILGGELKNIY